MDLFTTRHFFAQTTFTQEQLTQVAELSEITAERQCISIKINIYTIQLYIRCLIDTLRTNRGGTLECSGQRTDHGLDR